MSLSFTSIPEKELEVFNQLKNLKVIFDVGARDDVDYAVLCPKATCHLFEPHPLFFDQLKSKAVGLKNVVLNNFGLADRDGEFEYNEGLQAIAGSRPWSDSKAKGQLKVKIKTLDGYVKDHGIKRIDFLKMDTEGSELNILRSGTRALKITKYFQYEHWNNVEEFDPFLKDFHCELIGYRNVMCINHKLVAPKIMEDLVDFIRFNNYRVLV